MTAKIVVHGGAGFWRVDIKAALAGVREAASAGSRILLDGGSAVDAVEAAVTVMENDATFNAGKGSSLTLTGTVEMDAAIMNGADLSGSGCPCSQDQKPNSSGPPGHGKNRSRTSGWANRGKPGKGLLTRHDKSDHTEKTPNVVKVEKRPLGGGLLLGQEEPRVVEKSSGAHQA